jgi:hypothetical protein
MREQDVEFDIDRYRQLLTEAVDERRRLALIDLLIEERAMDRLQAHRVRLQAHRVASRSYSITSADPLSS